MVHAVHPISLNALALLVLCATLVELSSRPPAAVPATAPPTVFSAERAMRHLHVIAQRPHPSGSVEHARVREYLLGQLSAMDLQPQVQATTGVGTRYPIAAQVLNVIVRLPGQSQGGPAVLLVAHYDGVAAGPAAGDDGAGVAVLLETLRALRASSPTTHDVIALFSDAEEAGLAGAAAFAREHPWSRDVAFILNFEGRGTSGLSLMFETGSGNLDAVRFLRRVPEVAANSLSVTIYRALPNDTDLSELAVLNQPALNFAFARGLERYHTRRDDIEHLDAGSVQHHGAQALALARVIANGELPRPGTGDAIFFTVPLIGFIVYQAYWAIPLSVAAALLVWVGCVRLRRREARWLKAVSLGGMGIIVACILGALVAFGAGKALDRIHAAVPQGGSPGASGAYALAIVMVTVSLSLGSWTLTRRWVSAGGAQLGALVVWAALSLASAWKLPGASFVFVWPLLAAAGAALVERDQKKSLTVPLTSWAATLVATSVVVPLIYLVAGVIFGVIGPGAATVGLFVPLTAWLLAPRMEALTAGRRWSTEIALVAVAALFFVIGLSTVQRSDEHPEPSAVAYALDAEAPGAWLLTLPEFARPGSWGAGVLGPNVRAVAPGEATPPGGPPDWLTRAMSRESAVVATPAPRVAVGAPELNLIADSRTNAGRVVEFHVLPTPGTYSIRIQSVDMPVLAVEVDGRAIDVSRYRGPSPQWTLTYVAPSEKGFTLKLTVGRDTPMDLDLIARLLGLPQLPGVAIPQRPPGVVPIQAGDITAVYRRVRL